MGKRKENSDGQISNRIVVPNLKSSRTKSQINYEVLESNHVMFQSNRRCDLNRD